ncbi:amidophosphoribosyltransferase [candidate division KSB1 bacterium]|nr:amidophosphoribosyltransferase [candidate division KSB1 bacterium]MBL7092528.1 amidophosphoribosyltransferase [candidate division KSB1 bacterium]
MTTTWNDKPREECAVMGVHNHPNAANFVYLGLYSLQHRGQESSGIVTNDKGTFYKHVDMGLVADVYSKTSDMERLIGNIAIGHNRYSTTGKVKKVNAQPFVVSSKYGPMAIAHNGNLVNSQFLRRQLEDEGAIFQTTTDTEIVLHLIARSKKGKMIEKVIDSLDQIKGAFSLAIMTRKKLIGARDPRGFRPLCIGKKDGAYILASESCAFDILDAEYIREVEPGEVVVFDKDGMSTYRLTEKAENSGCVFEYIYFSRPDSRIFGEKVDKARRKLGKMLALEKPVDADRIIPVPDSSNTAALGYAQEADIRFEIGLIRNHYIGRTFIHPVQSMRDFNVRIKFNTVKGVLKNKRIVLIEDSIVRGTTLKHLVRMVRNAGAEEIHVRVSSPPILYPCYYGMDFPTKEELIASCMTIEKMRKYLEVDSLHYLSLDGLLNSVPQKNCSYCTACFSGEYPITPDHKAIKFQLEDGIVTD